MDSDSVDTVELSPDVAQKLFAAALAVQQRAYAPYSKFLVGAALLTSDNRIFSGCNIENASYGLCLCAERSAIAAAVSAGVRSWRAVAVASRGAVTPCGACRQVLSEFGLDYPIFLLDSQLNGQLTQRLTVAELLPGAFRLDSER
ncbi:MAG: cytidine deaminase [Planctomycetales bacterium]|nr:cytidine deaminase [Planctomycetales bacterium]